MTIAQLDKIVGMAVAIASIALLLAGCAEPNRVGVSQLTPDESAYYAQALAAGNSPGYWQPGTVGAAMAQGDTHRRVYIASLRGKGYPADERPLAARNPF